MRSNIRRHTAFGLGLVLLVLLWGGLTLAAPICDQCGKEITDKYYVTANGKHFHNYHFKCANCGSSLLNNPYYEKDGKFYDTPCYNKLFGPKCASCGQPIEGQWLEVDSKKYHEECYRKNVAPRCSYCGQPIEGQYYEIDSKIYHESCYRENVAPRCGVCNQPISGEYITSDGKVYHELCYKNSVAPRCAVCGGVLLGEYATDAFGNKFHREHLDEFPICEYCGRLVCEQITGGGVRYGDGREVCKLCLETAVNDPDEIKSSVADITNRLRRVGIDIKSKGIPVELVDRPGMRRIGGPDDVDGYVYYEIQGVLGGLISFANFKIYLLSGQPRPRFIATLAHELMHVWLVKNSPRDINQILCEGSCNYAAYLVLLSVQDSEPGVPLVLKQMFEDEDPVYGVGFRQIHEYVGRVGVNGWLEYLKNNTTLPW